MTETKKIEVVPFDKETADKILAEINEVLIRNGADIVVRPIISPEGTIEATAQIFKKVNEPVPTPSEFLKEESNGGTTTKEVPKAD